MDAQPGLQNERLADFRARHPTSQIEVDGVRWEYIASGCGDKTLLLLNGGMRVAETAFAYVELFEPHYRLLVPTYPPLWSVDVLTDGIRAILDAEGAQEVLILGQSYGGQVAQVMVQRFPSRAIKLVLSSTGPLAAPKVQRIALKLILALLPALPERTVKAVYKRSLLGILSIPEDRRVFWQAYLDHIFETRLTKADVLSHFRTGADALRNYAYGTRDPWPGQVLVLGGEEDAISSDQDRRGILEYYPNARQTIIGGAGHTPAMGRPDEFAESVRGFFDS